MIVAKNIRAHILKGPKRIKAFGILSKKPLSSEEHKIEESVFY
jgi:hypothetical protein